MFTNKKLAYYDLLCDCYNRNFLEAKLKKQYSNKSTFITIVDIDNFKTINDTFGHQKGDDALVQLINILKNTGYIDYICRYGGDEFILFHKKDNLNLAVQQQLFTKLTDISFSYGTAFKSDNVSVDAALEIADKKLYEEKGHKMEGTISELPNLVWFYVMNHKLTNEEWNKFCKRVSEAGLEDQIFKTSTANYEQYLKDFLDGKYIIVRKDK